ncbi:MAG: glycosyltransferase family 1 protein [Planctomycetota bacterium]|nr:MAG: glycosyltransferase family 1 protein [Planctomycetota bacterium]REK46562.1 MAG: glycosyltransferase family 1 protein [Planctomycetota bacterium]
MNILHLDQDVGTKGGGVASFIRDSAVSLSSRGFSIWVASAAEPDRVYPGIEQVEVLPQINDAAISDTSWRGRLERLVNEAAIDAVHVHEVKNVAITRYVAERLPTVIHLHNYGIICPGNDLFHNSSEDICQRKAGFGCLLCAYTKQCNNRHPQRLWQSLTNTWKKQSLAAMPNVRFVAGSRHIRDRVVAAGIPASKVDVVWYAADPDRLDAENCRPISGVSDDYVLYSGRLSKSKGITYLLDAFSRLRTKSTRLLLVGDGIYRSEVERHVAKLGLGDRVTLLGWRSGGELTWLYRNCQMLVVPSIWPEVFGIVGLEAMAAAKPVIATEVGGIPEWLDHEVSGYLVPPRNVESLTSRLEELLADTDRASAMGQAGRQRFVKYFTTDVQAEKLLTVYRTVTGREAADKEVPACTLSI